MPVNRIRGSPPLHATSCRFSQLVRYLRATYPRANITAINAAVGASSAGVLGYSHQTLVIVLWGWTGLS